jgi:MinD superfamily P-loop ATPase
MVKKANGAIYVNEAGSDLTLVSGQSYTGVKETNSVVQQTRAFAEKMVDKFDLIIFDSAAGIHCNVISAIEKVDQVIAVTEPTLVGQHDLKKLFELTDKLNSNISVVINRYDIADEKQIDKIERYGKPILRGWQRLILREI